jgi:hypothetical protein
MSEYYVLECYGPDDEEMAAVEEVVGLEDVMWNLGRPLTDKLDEPIEVKMDPSGGLMMPMFDRGILLFSDELIEALKSAGVNNLECYQVVLVNEQSHERWRDYKAVNIIGLVAAADLGASVYRPHGRPVIDVDFDSLAIDESKARGFLMFRLAENVSAIVVHKSVKQAVEEKGIRHLDFVEPQDWMG